MGVVVKFYRENWWIFINHRGHRKAKKCGDKQTALESARLIRKRLVAGDLGLFTPETSPPLRAFATAWLKAGDGTWKATTHRFYRFNLDLHILPMLGDKAIASLKRADCRALIVACRDKGLKPASMRGVNRTLSAVLSQAVEDALLPANPAFRMGRYLREGDAELSEVQPLTREDAHTLLETAETHAPTYYPLLLCALRTGLRLGELLGLQWGDVDLKGRFIHVRRTRVEGRLTSTKSKLARRVDLSLQLTETLQRLRTERKRAALASGEPMATWVFLTPDGHAVDGDNLRRRVFHRLLEHAGLRQIRVHDLRHTYASLLIQQGESLAYVQQQLGHSSIATTVDVYGHLLPGANRSAVDRLDARVRIPGATEALKADEENGRK